MSNNRRFSEKEQKMDLRTRKTLTAIRNAFIKLRSHKPLEKITVKELTNEAQISKATFYLHYQDVYDLSSAMQNEVIESVFGNIAHPEYILENTAEFTRELFDAFMANLTLIEILFSGNQFSILPKRIEERIKESVFLLHPDRKDDVALNMLITYRVQGSFYVYEEYKKKADNEIIIEVLSSIKPVSSAK